MAPAPVPGAKDSVPNSDIPVPSGKFVSMGEANALTVEGCVLSKMKKPLLDASHENESESFQALFSVMSNVWEYHVMSRVVPELENVTFGAVGAASKQTPPGLLLSPLQVKVTESARTRGATIAATISNAGIIHKAFLIFSPLKVAFFADPRRERRR